MRTWTAICSALEERLDAFGVSNLDDRTVTRHTCNKDYRTEENGRSAGIRLPSERRTPPS
jgi:hypothetical protein